MGDRHTSHCPNQISIIAHCRLNVCDDDHRSVVMIKFKASNPSKDWTERPHEEERLARASRLSNRTSTEEDQLTVLEALER